MHFAPPTLRRPTHSPSPHATAVAACHANRTCQFFHIFSIFFISFLSYGNTFGPPPCIRFPPLIPFRRRATTIKTCSRTTKITTEVPPSVQIKVRFSSLRFRRAFNLVPISRPALPDDVQLSRFPCVTDRYRCPTDRHRRPTNRHRPTQSPCPTDFTDPTDPTDPTDTDRHRPPDRPTARQEIATQLAPRGPGEASRTSVSSCK